MANLTRQPLHQKGQRPERVPAMRAAARDMRCTLALDGCRHDPAYTVGCHLRINGSAGMAQKPDDVFILDACDRCHAALDAGRVDPADVLRAFMQTLANRRAAGLIRIG